MLPCGGVVWIRVVQSGERGTFCYVGYSIYKASAAHIQRMITWEQSCWCLVPRGLAVVATCSVGLRSDVYRLRHPWTLVALVPQCWVCEILVWPPVSRAGRSCSDRPGGSGALSVCRNESLSVDVLPDFQLEVPPLGDLARVQAWDLVLPVQLPCPVGQLPFPAGKYRTGRVGVF